MGIKNELQKKKENAMWEKTPWKIKHKKVHMYKYNSFKQSKDLNLNLLSSFSFLEKIFKVCQKIILYKMITKSKSKKESNDILKLMIFFLSFAAR